MSSVRLRARHLGQSLWLACCCALAGSCDFADYATEAAGACTAYAGSTCATLQRCGAALLAPYGSLEGCTKQLGSSCLNDLMQPDVLSTSSAVRACGAQMASVDCSALLNRELPASCSAARGKRSNGAECSVNAQCAGGRCVASRVDGAWGECRELARETEPCLHFSDCAGSLVCTREGRCAPLAMPGDACSELAPCRAPFECVAGSCDQAQLAAGCDATSCPDDPAAAESACRALSEALCTRLKTCASSVVASAYGDHAICVVRTMLTCTARQRATDVVSSVAGLATCGQMLADVDCRALLDNALPAECQLAPGMRVAGQPCGDDAQCATTRCWRGAGAACGTCTALADAELPCGVSGDCAPGLVCTGDFVCRAAGVLDAACDPGHPCAYPLTCASGRCSPSLAAGNACDPASDRCDRYAGLACNTSTSTCSAWLLGLPGQSCALTATGWVECSAGSSCRITSGSSAGLCDGPAQDGAPCVVGMPPACLSPARCIQGVCVPPSPEAC
jgi:hypothetical protein